MRLEVFIKTAFCFFIVIVAWCLFSSLSSDFIVSDLILLDWKIVYFIGFVNFCLAWEVELLIYIITEVFSLEGDDWFGLFADIIELWLF